ncbi:hypothetical protein ATO6_16350 [Oceanicola sp. 22II-s10i]|nr:hypothetical protein ATO6_16350 [Oceanicola sp. 22II-s10i]
MRRAGSGDLRALSDLCLRSKAAWGYDDAFMQGCVAELTVTRADLRGADVVMLEKAGRAVAMAQVGAGPTPDEAELDRLFVAPEAMRQGFGRALMVWARAAARARGASRLRIDSDPNAEAFYLSEGAQRVGLSPSGSIPGRNLPQLVINLA